MKPRILVVDDEENIRFTFSTFLAEGGYEVETATNKKECVEHLERDFDLIFLDIMLGADSGIEILSTCKGKQPLCPVIMITGSPELKTAAEAVRLGAYDYIPKPVRHETLMRLTKSALAHKALIDQKEALRTRLKAIFASVKEGIVTVDEEMRITDLNDSARIIFECDDLVGRSLEELVRDNPACLELVRNSLKTTRPTDVFRVEMFFADDVSKILSLTTSPLIDEAGKILGAVLTARDETRLDHLERDLGERRFFDRMIGANAKMQDLFGLIEALAAVDSTVLVLGESGTGKELVAESLHYRSGRAGKELVKVNCAALPETLLESELFGHVKGSFTGAMHDKTGRFQQADGGTIFLDEIADISPEVQVRLLRVLQEKEIEKVGGQKPIKVDIRVVAATNKDLKSLVEEGKFREDLYYRLKVVVVKIPPLRERMEDIPLLVEHFIRVFNKKFKRQISGVAESVMACFMGYGWPGNIRELEHVIEHAFILCRDEMILVHHLPEDLQNSLDDAKQQPVVTGESREAIIEALRACGGNKSKAAEMLGISRRTIYRKIEEYGIAEEDFVGDVT
ncbi:MAG: sigma-54-dependent Fis family transcriptional regulator [Desulfuromonas sp.]|nr:MAG: sigma-54-dependent Fis family transcriptional regulator [Desulfuromonas sp.]